MNHAIIQWSDLPSSRPSSLESLEKVCHPVVSQSYLRTLDRCPRYALWSYHLGLKLARAHRSPAATTGTLAHGLLQCRYAAGSDVTDAEVEESCQTLVDEKVAEEQALLEGDLTGQAEANIQAIGRAWDVARTIVRIFWDRYPLPDDIEVLDSERTIIGSAISRSQEGPVGGTLDLALRKGDDTWLVDHKTVSEDPAKRFKGYSFDPQYQLYPLLWGLTKGEAPVGFIFNYIQVPTIKFCKKDKTFNDYVARCGKWYDQQDHAPITSWAIRINPKTHLTEEFEEKVDDAIWRANSHWWSGGHWEADWPRHSCSCRLYNRECPYLGLCEACDGPEGKVATVLADNFIQKLDEPVDTGSDNLDFEDKEMRRWDNE